MQKIRDHIAFGILVIVYLLASVRFFPGEAAKTVVETLLHLFSVAPISLGATLIIVALLQRLAGDRLPVNRIIRVFLLVAIFLEFILGLSHYYTVNGIV